LLLNFACSYFFYKSKIVIVTLFGFVGSQMVSLLLNWMFWKYRSILSMINTFILPANVFCLSFSARFDVVYYACFSQRFGRLYFKINRDIDCDGSENYIIWRLGTSSKHKWLEDVGCHLLAPTRSSAKCHLVLHPGGGPASPQSATSCWYLEQ